jgi:signal transduction histidine kinase/FixJ family two-component response regulator
MLLQEEKPDILIVDDTLPNLQVLATMLRTNGYSVRDAMDGPSALANITTKLPDMVLLDIRMPGMDGYEVCQRLKADEQTRSIPVIFVSALDEQEDKVQGFAVGGVDYITKPFQAREVLARVGTHLTLRNLQRQLEARNAQLQLEITERKHFESALRKANEGLEMRVLERTTELEETNIKLLEEITERRQAEAEREQLLIRLQEQAQQMREIMNTVPEGVLLLNSAGQVLLANPVAEENLRLLADAGEGDVLYQLGDRRFADLLEIPQGHLWHEVRKDASIFEVIARPMPDGPQPEHWVMILRDVTQEREAQQRAQQQERLAAVGQLAAGIAHDFNNILAVILLYTEMSLSTPDLQPRLRDRLATVAQQAQRATDLVQQILDFSRRSVLERQPMDMLPFLKEQVKLLKRTMPENISIGLTYDESEFMIHADPTRMQQAIMNLVVNARDAMPEGGSLHISLSKKTATDEIRCVSCGLVTGKAWVEIKVSDSGTGMPPELLARIFEPFFSTKAAGMGTGLGLAQVYGIIKQHEGHIDVSSKPFSGSEFQVYLPALPTQQPPAVVQQPISITHGEGQTILLVEDDAATRKALSDGLTLLNYRVLAMENGNEALELVSSQPSEVNLILSDVVMPELGGIELVRALRQRGLGTPVVLMTGHPVHDELEKLQEEGLVTWLPKPPRLKQLAEVIVQTLIRK